jgi:trk system potassium uptake protein TrkA
MRFTRDVSGTEEPLGEQAATDYYVLAGEHVGASIADRLSAADRSAAVIDETEDSIGGRGPGSDSAVLQALRDAGIPEESTVVVATPRDGWNLLVAQLVRIHFDVADVLVLVNAPDQCDLFADAGHEPVCATTALSDAVVDALEHRTHDTPR